MLQFSIVPNQRAWNVGDPINDVSGVGSAAGPETVQTDTSGRFTVKAWDRPNQRRGVYDIVVHRLRVRGDARRVGPNDLIAYAAESGFTSYALYPIGDTPMDSAAQPPVAAP